MSRLRDRPRPVPLYLRLVDPSACLNASKITAAALGATPIPESRSRRRQSCLLPIQNQAPLEGRSLLVAAHWRTNLTMRQLAPPPSTASRDQIRSRPEDSGALVSAGRASAPQETQHAEQGRRRPWPRRCADRRCPAVRSRWRTADHASPRGQAAPGSQVRPSGAQGRSCRRSKRLCRRPDRHRAKRHHDLEVALCPSWSGGCSVLVGLSIDEPSLSAGPYRADGGTMEVD